MMGDRERVFRVLGCEVDLVLRMREEWREGEGVRYRPGLLLRE